MIDFIVAVGLAPWVVLFALFALFVLLLAALVLAPLWAPLAAAVSLAWDRWREKGREDRDATPE